MAGNAYSDEVMEATNWLKDKSSQEVFSFVFKNENIQLNGRTSVGIVIERSYKRTSSSLYNEERRPLGTKARTWNGRAQWMR